MRDEPLWIDRDELHLLYARQVELCGGSSGVRDEKPARIRAAPAADAVQRCRLTPLCSALPPHGLVGFVKNHAFVDGSMRIGLATAPAFLGANGWPDHWTRGRVARARARRRHLSEADEPTAAAWLRQHAEPRG